MNSRPAHRFGLLALADTAALAFAASAVWPASAATFRFERNVVPAHRVPLSRARSFSLDGKAKNT